MVYMMQVGDHINQDQLGAEMRNPSKNDVDDSWNALVATELAVSENGGPDDALTPITALRLMAQLRFNSTFCDYVLLNEPQRIVEVTQPDVMRAVKERESDLNEWREDWATLPDSPAKKHALRRLTEAHRSRMELVCLRHLWLALQAVTPSASPPVGDRETR
jgi:hypothetical protein